MFIFLKGSPNCLPFGLQKPGGEEAPGGEEIMRPHSCAAWRAAGLDPCEERAAGRSEHVLLAPLPHSLALQIWANFQRASHVGLSVHVLTGRGWSPIFWECWKQDLWTHTGAGGILSLDTALLSSTSWQAPSGRQGSPGGSVAAWLPSPQQKPCGGPWRCDLFLCSISWISGTQN